MLRQKWYHKQVKLFHKSSEAVSRLYRILLEEDSELTSGICWDPKGRWVLVESMQPLNELYQTQFGATNRLKEAGFHISSLKKGKYEAK